MRFFHLADLHLGKRVNGFSMIEDQAYILKQITDLADLEAPDAVIIAGDVYDKSIPSVEAVNLFDDFLVSLSQRNLQVFVISGNHDSAERISYGGRVMQQSGIHISQRITGAVPPPSDNAPAQPSDDTSDQPSDVASDQSSECSGEKRPTASPVLPVRLEDAYGPLNVYLFPYIHPSVVRAVWPDETAEDWTQAMEVLIRHTAPDPGERNIAVAHQFVTAQGIRPEECDSEQKHIGGLDNVEYHVFDAFDYVALGHLHGPQRIGRDSVRYAGSPLKYSFSEENQKKSVTIVDLKEKGNVQFRLLPLHPLRDLRTVRGTFDELTSPEFTAALPAGDYYRIILTDEQDVDQAISRLRKYFYTNLMELSYDNARTKAHVVTDVEQEVLEREPSEVLEELYEKQNGSPMSEFQKELTARLIDEIWNLSST